MNFMLKRQNYLILFSFLLFVSMSLSLSCTKKQMVENGIAARVGSEEISADDVLRSISGKARQEVKENPDSLQSKEIIKSALDKVIDWNVLYLAGKSESLDKTESYGVELRKMRIGLLSGMYLHQKVNVETEISDELIKEYYDKMGDYLKGRKLDDELKSKIKFVIIDEKYGKYSREFINKVKSGHKFEIYKDKIIALLKDDKGADDTLIGQLDDYSFDWKEFKLLLGRTPASETTDVIIKMVQEVLEKVMLANEAEKIGMEKKDSFNGRMRHFEKNAIALAKRIEISKGASPTDDEVKALYKENKKEYTIPESVDINIILISDEEDAKNVRKELDKDANKISELALKYSAMKNVKENNGVFEIISKKKLNNMVDSSVAKTVFSSQTGKVKGPLKGEKGYYIFRVNHHMSKKITPFDKVKDKLASQLKDKKVDEAIQELRKKTDVKVFPGTLKFNFNEI